MAAALIQPLIQDDAWLVYGESILGAAALGLLSALVFYAAWRRLGHVRPG